MSIEHCILPEHYRSLLNQKETQMAIKLVKDTFERKLADNLREERSNSYSGSVDWTTHFGHWQANILVEGFYTDLRHVFVLEDI